MNLDNPPLLECVHVRLLEGKYCYISTTPLHPAPGSMVSAISELVQSREQAEANVSYMSCLSTHSIS